MQPSVPASSSSISAGFRAELRAIGGSWRAKLRDRLRSTGVGGYLLIWMAIPIFQLALLALVYHGRHDLLSYVVVAVAGQVFIDNAIYYVGEILDRERIGGTLVALFLTPCSRLSWLTGFALVGLVEATFIAIVTLLFGHFALGVHFHPNVPSVLVSLALFLASLWGMGFVFSAIGLILKKANQFSNLVFPLVTLLGGIYYPVDRLPDWLRYPARALPFGYGMQALASASLRDATVGSLLPQLLPLAGFAVALPVLGTYAFRRLERMIRERGELELY